MRLFGFEVSRTKAAVPRAFQSLEGARGGWSSFWMGAGRPETDFQRDIDCAPSRVSANWAVFSCTTLIASDIGKVNLGLKKEVDGIWESADSAAFSPVLKKPNRFQTRQKFIESWVVSKLSAGNAYILKERDDRGIVVEMYVLDPSRVTPLVSPNGQVFYKLQSDLLAGLPQDEEFPAVPASEIIHDTMVCLFHPLVGIPPVYAHGLAAVQGLEIQLNSATFFLNRSRPGGVLSSEQQISDEYAAALKSRWDANYSAGNSGKVAVLGGGLTYQGMTTNAVDAQMVEQLKMSAEMVCSTFHVPAFKIGAGVIPAGQKVEDLNQIYYADCLHALMDAIQTLLVEGLGLDTPKEGTTYSVRFDLDDLLKMDTATFIATLKTAIDGSIMAPNEARLRMNLKPVPGGDAPLSQQQNFSLEALSKRDAGTDPFGTAKPPPAEAPPIKGIETILVGVVEAQKQLELGLAEKLEAIDKRFDEEPDEAAIAQIQVDGAKRFAEMLKRALETEPACV